jgi:hypothetical protein
MAAARAFGIQKEPSNSDSRSPDPFLYELERKTDARMFLRISHPVFAAPRNDA